MASIDIQIMLKKLTFRISFLVLTGLMAAAVGFYKGTEDRISSRTPAAYGFLRKEGNIQPQRLPTAERSPKEHSTQ